MLRRAIALAVLLGAVLFFVGEAEAASCSFKVGGTAGTTVTGNTFSLTNNNLGLTDVSVTLCLGTSGGNTFIELAGVHTDSSTGAYAFINQIGINGTSTFLGAFKDIGSQTFTFLGWSTGPDHCSGFDGFQATYTACGQGAGNSFGASGDYWVFSGNSSPTQIVVHIAFANCTGFFGGTANTKSTFSTSQCGVTSTPEPSSLSLLGPGIFVLAGFGVFFRRLSFRAQ